MKRYTFSTDDRNLYCFADNLKLCQQLLDGGAEIIQLRVKLINDDTFFELAKDMKKLVQKYPKAIFIINDRVDIAIEVQADGVHVGQEDEDYLSVIKRIPGDMITGVSVDNAEDAIKAEIAGATYVGAGAVFPTSTKSDSVVIGTERLQEIVQAINIPVVAIGGISRDNIKQVIATGAQYYAIISEINDADNISERLNQFYKLIDREIS